MIRVNSNPPVFAFKEFVDSWKEHTRLRTCPVCGNTFIPKNPQEIYCSDRCRNRADYERKKEKKKEYLRNRKDLTRRATRRYTSKLMSLAPANKKGAWTFQELEFIKRAYEEKGHLSKRDLVEIARVLGRSYKAVEHKYYKEVRR